jgi:hypothetical protein
MGDFNEDLLEGKKTKVVEDDEPLGLIVNPDGKP